jgi:hypothetical protein
MNLGYQMMHSSLVATLKLHTNLLFPIDFNSGSPPKFPTISQAVGSLNLARLSQQLADFNGDWKPDWGNGRAKYCISSEFTDGTILLKICLSYSF